MSSRPGWRENFTGKKMRDKVFLCSFDELSLRDSVSGSPEMGTFTTWASTGRGKTLSVLKNIPTPQATGGANYGSFRLGRHGAVNMRKMLVDFLFPDAYSLRNFPGTHLLFTEQGDFFLTNRLHAEERLACLREVEHQ
jgi:hypothetical protein